MSFKNEVTYELFAHTHTHTHTHVYKDMALNNPPRLICH